MQDIVHNSPICNGGHGVTAVNGRGVRRRKLTLEQRIGLATDVALGLTPFAPSIGQAATAFGVSPYNVRQELKTRAAAMEAAERAEREAAALDEAYAINQLIDAWRAASVNARETAVHQIGVAAIWDVIVGVIA